MRCRQSKIWGGTARRLYHVTAPLSGNHNIEVRQPIRGTGDGFVIPARRLVYLLGLDPHLPEELWISRGALRSLDNLASFSFQHLA